MTEVTEKEETTKTEETESEVGQWRKMNYLQMIVFLTVSFNQTIPELYKKHSGKTALLLWI